MLTQTTGVFLQTLRAGLRGRGTWVLPALLAAGSLLLPRALRGDGPAEAGYSLAVRYTLGFAAFVLAVSGTVSGAASMAADRRSGALALTLAKPVRAGALFAGKWLGTLASRALFLALTHALVLLPLRFGATADGEPFAARMRSRGVINATLAPARDVARAALERMRGEGLLPGDVPERVVFKDLVRRAEQGYDAAAGGESITWRFHARRALGPGRQIGLRLTLDQQWGMLGQVHGMAGIRPAGAAEWHEMEVDGAVAREVETPFTRFDPAGHSVFEARFTNLGGGDSEPVLIHPGRGVALLVYGKSFWANAARAYAMQLALIAVFAALGVMFGAAFSTPVSAFAATVLHVLILVAPVLAEESQPGDGEEENGLFMRAGRGITVFLQKSFDPLVSSEPLAKLTRGDQIPAPTLAKSMGIGFLLFPASAMLVFQGILRLRKSQEDG